MQFEYPWVLLFLLLFIFCEWRCPLRIDLLLFPHVRRIVAQKKRTTLVQAFKWMAISGLLFALTSPVVVERYIPKAPARDMVLVLDASRSMDDAFSITQKENKFETLKKIVKDFILRRGQDRLGIVLFGEYPFIVSPLTFDHKMLSKMVPYLHVGIAGERTAIYDALAMAVKLLKSSEAKSKVIVLLTDGKNTAGKVPLDVAEKLIRTYGIKLYTIGIGHGGNYDAKVLRSLAKAGGGAFFSAKDPKTLAQIYERIERLETTPLKQRMVTKKRYLFHYPLYVAALSLLIYLFLMNRSEV